MTSNREDELFLLEALVDHVVLSQTPCLDGKVRTCVTVECLNTDTLEICDTEAANSPTAKQFVRRFNCGKSCLFSMNPADVKRATERFPIKVTVATMLPCGCFPTKIVAGHATIDMTKEFMQAYRAFVQDPTVVSYQALKDNFRLINDDAPAGTISLFLRISCFGHRITTKFSGTPGRSGMLGDQLLDGTCNPPRTFQTHSQPCGCGNIPGGVGNVCGGNTSSVCPMLKDQYDTMPCVKDDVCYCAGPPPEREDKMVCRNTDQYCLHIPKDCCPRGNKLAFKLPLDPCSGGHKQRMHFKTVDGVGDMSRDEGGADGVGGVVYDFSKNVIKLRVGKTVEMAGHKSRLEYQFVTPVPCHKKTVTVADDSTAQCAFPPCRCCRNC